MISGIVVVSIHTTNSARYATVSATPTRHKVGSARSVLTERSSLRSAVGASPPNPNTRSLRSLSSFLVLAEHLAQDIFERRVLDREVGRLERAQHVPDDLGNLPLRHLERHPLRLARHHGAEPCDL